MDVLSIAVSQAGLKSSHTRRPYAGREASSKHLPHSRPFSPSHGCALPLANAQWTSSKLHSGRGWRNAMGSGLSCNIVPRVLAASPKSECGHIKCDMGHAPRCHNRLANCSCLGAGRIHDRFRRRGRWLDYRDEIRVFRPGPEPQAARSCCAISRLSLPRARAPITICDQQSARARRGFERRARLPARPPAWQPQPVRQTQPRESVVATGCFRRCLVSTAY